MLEANLHFPGPLHVRIAGLSTHPFSTSFQKMRSSATTRTREKKCAERENLVAEMELLLGLASDHPEDAEIIAAPQVSTLPPTHRTLIDRAEEIVRRLKQGDDGWTVLRVVQAFVRSHNEPCRN